MSGLIIAWPTQAEYNWKTCQQCIITKIQKEIINMIYKQSQQLLKKMCKEQVTKETTKYVTMIIW